MRVDYCRIAPDFRSRDLFGRFGTSGQRAQAEPIRSPVTSVLMAPFQRSASCHLRFGLVVVVVVVVVVAVVVVVVVAVAACRVAPKMNHKRPSISLEIQLCASIQLARYAAAN